jgi:hypothetical protein
MPSAGDFFNEVKATNVRLDNLIAATNGVRGAVDTVDNDVKGSNTRLDTLIVSTNAVKAAVDDVSSGIDQLITIDSVIRDAVIHTIKQNDTIICLLTQIADHTCRILNQSVLQTGLQTIVARDTTTLSDLYSVTHAEAALIRDRELALKKQIEECCPPEVAPPACQPQRCPDPGKFEPPRDSDRNRKSRPPKDG